MSAPRKPSRCSTGVMAFQRSHTGWKSSMVGAGVPAVPASTYIRKISAPEPRCESTWAIDQSWYDGAAEPIGGEVGQRRGQPVVGAVHGSKQLVERGEGSLFGGFVGHVPCNDLRPGRSIPPRFAASHARGHLATRARPATRRVDHVNVIDSRRLPVRGA